MRRYALMLVAFVLMFTITTPARAQTDIQLWAVRADDDNLPKLIPWMTTLDHDMYADLRFNFNGKESATVLLGHQFEAGGLTFTPAGGYIIGKTMGLTAQSLLKFKMGRISTTLLNQFWVASEGERKERTCIETPSGLQCGEWRDGSGESYTSAFNLLDVSLELTHWVAIGASAEHSWSSEDHENFVDLGPTATFTLPKIREGDPWVKIWRSWSVLDNEEKPLWIVGLGYTIPTP